MKVTKEFAPVTIVLETEKDVLDFERILRAAANAAYDFRAVDPERNKDIYEQCCILLQDLTK